MNTSGRIAIYLRHSASRIMLATFVLVSVAGTRAEAQQSPTHPSPASSAFATSWTRLGLLDHALALRDVQARNARPPIWRPADVDHTHRRWPLRADPRRWPRLFANTSECTLSFDPVLRRHWWQ